MYRNKYTMLVHALSLLVILLKIFVFKPEEVAQDVSNLTPTDGVPIEVGLEEEVPFFDQNITTLFIDGRTLNHYPSYQDILNQTKNKKGIILSTKDYILTNNLTHDPDFNFIPVKHSSIKFILYELDSYHYAIGIKSNQSLVNIRYNTESNSDYFFKKADLIHQEEHYPLYKIDKFNLELISNNGIILKDLNKSTIEIENVYKDLNFNDEFIWKKGETKLLSDF